MDNPWLKRRVLAYAHQGGAREAPASTLYAIERAIALGTDAIELDVHQTRDGVLVVTHDPSVQATSNGQGVIAEMDLAQLRDLDYGFWFVEMRGAVVGLEPSEYPFRARAASDSRFGIATLEEVLSNFPGVFLNLDIKQSAPQVPAYEHALARMLRAYGRRDDVIVASFNDRSIASFKAVAPEVGTAPGAGELALLGQALFSGGEVPSAIRRHVALQVPTHYKDLRVVDERLVALAHGLGLAVHVWTIDDAQEMAELVALGVDGIMSDRPSVLVKVLEDLEVRYRPQD